MSNNCNFKNDIQVFISHIDSLSESLPLTNLVISASSYLTEADFNSFVKKRGNEINGEIHYEIPSSDLTKFNRLRKRKESTELASKIIQRSFITSLVSQYDAYVGRIIKNILFTVPEYLNISDKKISIGQLMKFGDIEDAKEYVIEKEVESVLRENHAQHFKYLESKLKIPYTKDLEILPQFIEITERRNLFVHADGKISSQYLNVCKKNNVQLPSEIKHGDELTVNEEYFQNAYKCIYELGVKLGIVTWRKVLPEEKVEADSFLNYISYELIHEEQYDLAIKFLEFGLKMPKISSEQIKLTYIINLAQAYKWLGENEKAKKILSQQDWSANSNIYKICVFIIKEEFSEAIELMAKVIDDIDKNSYHEWPIFKQLRKSKAFKVNYKEIYEEEFKEASDNDLLGSLNKLVSSASPNGKKKKE